jgi:hypothetical protein
VFADIFLDVSVALARAIQNIAVLQHKKMLPYRELFIAVWRPWRACTPRTGDESVPSGVFSPVTPCNRSVPTIVFLFVLHGVVVFSVQLAL